VQASNAMEVALQSTGEGQNHASFIHIFLA